MIDPGNDRQPLATRVANAIAVLIAADLILRQAPTEIPCALPSERDLAWELGVSYGTMRRSMALLRERGLVITRPSRPGGQVADG